MPARLLIFGALLRFAILVAVVLAVAAALYYRHRNRQLQLQSRELETQIQQLQQRDNQRTESFSTTVHELRAPLTSIRGALVLLSAGATGTTRGTGSWAGSLDERAANLLRIATGNTGRLIRLIDELLDLERMESGAGRLELRSCSLDQVMAQAVETMSPMAQEAGIVIETLPFPTGPLYFAGDSGRMVQVLCNLLSNAIKFSPHGSVVTVALRTEPNSLVVRVQDQGRGIPGNKLEAVFERFVRVGQSIASNHEPDRRSIPRPACSGLGLAISRGIVSQHGGSLHAERNDSDVPGIPGTTLTLRLPRVNLIN